MRIFIIFSLFFLVGTTLPSSAPLFANGGETTYEQAYVPCGNKDENPKDGKVDNPCGFKDVIELARRLMLGWIMASVTIGAMGFAYAGFLYITAMGSQEKISHAHSIFVKVFWGLVFMLSAWLIVKTLEAVFLTDEMKARSFLYTKPPSGTGVDKSGSGTGVDKTGGGGGTGVDKTGGGR